MTDNQFSQLFDLVTICVGGIQRLEQDVSGLKQDVSTLKQDVGTLKEDVSELKQGQIKLEQVRHDWKRKRKLPIAPCPS